MKKISTIIIVLLLAAVFTLPVFAQTFDQDLYFGIQKDSDVTKLQEFLTEQGIYFGPISGNFFSLTLRAVKSFQTQQGVSPVSGYFGPKTRGKANQILAAEGVNFIGVTDESGSITPVTTVPSKTTNDVVASLAAQIQLLQQQLNALQQQQQTLQTIQQQQTTQTQALQQVQQNTTPPPPPPLPPPPPSPVVEDLKTGWDNSIIFVDPTQSTPDAPMIIWGRVDTKDGNSKLTIISFSAPDWSTESFLENGQMCTLRKQDQKHICSNDKTARFYYYPKTLGIQTISISAEGITKTVNIDVRKSNPIITDIENKDFIYERNIPGSQTIGRFKIGTGGEILYIKKIIIEYDFSWVDGFLKLAESTGGIAYAGPSSVGINTTGTNTIVPSTDWVLGRGNDDKFWFMLAPFYDPYGNPRTDLSVGQHSITIKSIELIGQFSGLYRYVSGLPITLTFEVK